MTFFWRIFMSFWLVAVLLAGSFFVLGRLSSSEIIDRHLAALQAQAELVAGLWNSDGGQPAVMHWLARQQKPQKARLLTRNGRNPFPGRMMGMMKRQASGSGTIQAGIHQLPDGRILLAAQLPGIQPALFLVRKLAPQQLHRIPLPLMLALAVLIIALVSFLLASMLVKRLRSLRETVQVISDGDLSARVTLGGQDEISALATDFNRMADRIGEMMASQRQLVSDVSHELRSPLARLRIALELAERADDPRQMLQKIAKEADELEHMVSSLLSLARMESGQSVLEKHPQSLCPLLRKIIDDANFEGKASQRRVVLKSCEDIELQMDTVLMQSAIENVIRNALHYTPQGGEVQVTVEPSGEQIRIIIEDQGPGVPEKELERLFEPFARVGEARDRHSGGYGLGLAITGKALQAHAGKAHAENRPQGGLRVILSLPMIR
jgi:two-component system sensor histidine kinase CpxA